MISQRGKNASLLKLLFKDFNIYYSKHNSLINMKQLIKQLINCFKIDMSCFLILIYIFYF